MACQKAVAVLLAMLFVHSIPTAAFQQLQASTSADGLHRQAPTATATYIMGGGYRDPSGRAVETSCGDVGLLPITTFEECRSAAEQVGIAVKEMVGPAGWDHVPYGCSVLQGDATPTSGAVGTSGRVHFGTTHGNNNGGLGGYVMICKNNVESQPPQTGTTMANPSRIAVFSAQFGGRDRVQYKNSHTAQTDTEDVSFNPWSQASHQFREKLEQFQDGVDAFLFTDMVKVVHKHNSPWEFVYPARQFEENCDDNVLCLWKASSNLTQAQKKMQNILQSKFYKMRWIAENPQYDYIVWMDGKYLMNNNNLTQTVHRYMREGVDMLAMKHPERRTVAEELGPASKRSAQILSDDSVIEKAEEIYKRYKSEGFSDTRGLFDSAMFIVRPARVRDMFLDWWHEVQQGVPRDQLSLPWMMQKHRINVVTLSSGACAILGPHCENPGAHK